MNGRRGLSLGVNTLNGRKVLIDESAQRLHTLVVGGTGRGKSKLLELLVRHHLEQRHGLLLLDPHGQLYSDLLAYAAVSGHRHNLVLINANDTESSVGLNFLARNRLDVSAHASQVMKAIAKVFGEAEGEVKPRLERWQRNLLISLIEANLTLADMLDFLSVSRPAYRQAALESVRNPYVRQEWQGFEAITKRTEKETLIEAPLNRAAKMILSDPVRRIIGQQRSTIDIGEAVEQGKAVFVNLAPQRVARECQQILGILLVDQIINYAIERTSRQARRPFFVVVDEAAELTSNDLPYSLQALRKFGIYFTLCYQTLAQIKRLPGYYESVMTNCDVKVAFKSSRQDSEELIGELFAGQIRGTVVKDELRRTLLIPQETVRKVTSVSRGRADSYGEVDTHGYAAGTSAGSSSAQTYGSLTGEQATPPSGFFAQEEVTSLARSQSDAFAVGDFQLDSSSYSDSHSTVTTHTESESTSAAVVPFYEYLREMELANRQYFTIEEIKEKYIAWVMCQPQRHCQLKLKDDKAIPLLIDFVGDVRARERDKAKLCDHSSRLYAIPAAEVDGLIEERRRKLLAVDDVSDVSVIDVPETETTRWQ